MEIYSVGGWVRDFYLRKLLHLDLPEGDHDWVVVGATPQEMINAGYRPVGKDFPVFLHPKTHEEYALARLERKVAPGYHGFEFNTSPSVTLKEDLSRRDLTINAMAFANDQLFDPFGGLDDILHARLRHVSSAFKEDPVRILRVARFGARLPMFSVAEETMSLMQEMVKLGEADALVAERIFQEFKKGLMESKPSRMIEILHDCGLWQRLFPNIHISRSDVQRLDFSALHGFSLAERFAALLLDHQDIHDLNTFFKTLKSPTDITELVLLCAKVRKPILQTQQAFDKLQILLICDALRRPERFYSILRVLNICENIDQPYWYAILQCVRQIDAATIARKQTDKRNIPGAIREAQLNAIKDFTS